MRNETSPSRQPGTHPVAHIAAYYRQRVRELDWITDNKAHLDASIARFDAAFLAGVPGEDGLLRNYGESCGR